MGRHRAPDPTRPVQLPRREPGTALPADLVPAPREPEEVPPLDMLARVRDGLTRLGPSGRPYSP
jgi:hypothetical protein